MSSEQERKKKNNVRGPEEQGMSSVYFCLVSTILGHVLFFFFFVSRLLVSRKHKVDQHRKQDEHEREWTSLRTASPDGLVEEF